MKMISFKKFISKNVAYILSFALIAGVLVPVLSLNKTSAASEAEKNSFISEIKSAWGKMSVGDTALRPTAEKVNNKPATVFTENEMKKSEKDNIPYDGKITALGDTFSYFSGSYNGNYSFSGSSTSSTERFLYYNKKTDYVDFDFSGYTGFQISMYIEDVSSEGEILPLFVYRTSGKTAEGKKLTITSDMKGKWVNFKDTDLYNGGIAKLAEDKGTTEFVNLQLNLCKGLKLKAVSGSLVMTKTVSLPENSASWNLSDWISAALKLDYSKYLNYEELTALLNRASTEYKEDYSFAKLKDAWKNLKYKTGETVYVASREKAAGTNYDASKTNSSNYFMNTDENFALLPSGIQKSDIGDGYLKFERSYNADSFNDDRLMYGTYSNFDSIVSSNFKIDEYPDFTLSLYIEDVKKDGEVVFEFITRNWQVVRGKTINLTPADNGKWITFKFSDMYDGTVADLSKALKDIDIAAGKQENQSGFLGFMQILSLGAVYKGYAGSFIGLKNNELPENISSMTIADFILEAQNLDLSAFDNTQQFTDTLNELVPLFEDELVLSKLKKAWSNMSSESTIFVPSREKAANKNYDADKDNKNVYFSSTNTASLPAGITSKDLGSNYLKFTRSYDLNSNSSDRIMIGTETDFNNYESSKIKISDYSNLRLAFYIEDVKKAGTISFEFINTASKTYLNKTYSVSASDKGKWFVLSDDDMYRGGISALKKAYDSDDKNFAFMQLNFSGGAIIKGYCGSLVGLKNAKLPKNTENWNLADWIYAASILDVSQYVNNVEEFKAALASAIELRDRKQISRSSELTSFHNFEDFDTTKIEGNILTGKTPEVTYYNGTSAKITLNTETTAALTDGTISADAVIAGAAYDTEECYTDIVYNINGKATISDIYIANSINEALRNTKYYIYASTGITDLFDTNSLIAVCDNSAKDAVTAFNYTKTGNITANYLAIRVTKPYSDKALYDGNIRFSEIAAIGTVKNYTVEKGDFSNEKIASIGKSLISNKVASFRNKDGIKVEYRSVISNQKYELNGLTDGNNSTLAYGGNIGTKVDGTAEYIDIYYKLDDVYQIKKFFVNGMREVPGLEPGSFEIYVSKDLNSLFLSKNRVVSFDNSKNSEEGTSVSNLITLEGDGAVGKFVSFRITSHCSDFESAKAKYGLVNLVLRLSELGVYGTERPLEETNLLAHMPVKVYRTSGNNKNLVSETEYTGKMHQLIYDGLYNQSADINTNNKTVDFVFNLSADQKLNSIEYATMTDNIRKLKVYAADDESGVWDESKLVYTYTGGQGEKIIKDFGNGALKARYLRFSVEQTEGNILDTAEIKATGWNNQEFDYLNVVEEKSDKAFIMLEDRSKNYKRSISLTSTTKYNPGYEKWPKECYKIENAFDNNDGTVYDIYGGNNDTTSVNILCDLETMKVIESISVRAASSKEYWPTKLKYYIGENDDELFGKDAKPVAEFNGKTSDPDGYYEYTTLPKTAQYIRIEISESKVPYYDQTKIGTVIKDIVVNGLEFRGKVDENGATASFTDTATGIRLDIMAKNENDFYGQAKEMLVVKRNPDEHDLDYIKSKDLTFKSEIYEIYLLDADGNIIDDIDSREMKIYIPQSLGGGGEDIFLMVGDIGFNLVEAEIDNGYFIYTTNDLSILRFAIGEFFDYPSEDTEEYDDEEYEDEDYDDEDEEEIDEDTSSSKRRVKKIIIRRGSSDFEYLWIIIVAAAVVVAGAGTAVYFLILRKKRKNGANTNE